MTNCKSCEYPKGATYNAYPLLNDGTNSTEPWPLCEDHAIPHALVAGWKPVKIEEPKIIEQIEQAKASARGHYVDKFDPIIHRFGMAYKFSDGDICYPFNQRDVGNSRAWHAIYRDKRYGWTVFGANTSSLTRAPEHDLIPAGRMINPHSNVPVEPFDTDHFVGVDKMVSGLLTPEEKAAYSMMDGDE